MNKKAFTLIEILVTIGIIGVTMVVVGTVMTNSFNAQKKSEELAKLSAKAVFINGELKRNILDAERSMINCPVGGVGSSLSFGTKSGGTTSLLCDEVSGEIASASANGRFPLSGGGVYAFGCNNFVRCNLSGDRVVSVDFNLNLGSSGSSQIGSTGYFQGVVAPRE